MLILLIDPGGDRLLQPSVGFEAVSSVHLPAHLPRLRHSSGINCVSLPIPNTRSSRHWIGRKRAVVLIDGQRPADRRERPLRTGGPLADLAARANRRTEEPTSE